MAEVKDNSSIQLFEDQKIRTAWDAEVDGILRTTPGKEQMQER